MNPDSAPQPSVVISESEQFARRLAVEVPGLKDLWGVHLMETAGKVLPYIFLLDVSVWAEESAVVAPASAQGLLMALERRGRRKRKSMRRPKISIRIILKFSRLWT